jgi:mono/diheme cytochrome c family protein
MSNMRTRRSTIGLFVLAIITFAAMYPAPRAASAQSESAAPAALTPKLREERTSATDLEISGDLAGLTPGMTRYATRDDLLALPQVTYSAKDDPNFAGPAQVKGVQLEDLVRALGVAPTDLVVAICDDKYHANYPREYREQHNPVLVLEVNGKPPSGWPKDSGGHRYDMGPYMISHAKFTAGFRVLSYSEESQIPWGVVRLEFRDEKAVFGAIAPLGAHANDPAVQAGYKIAQQNCFRCHNMESDGGQKAGIPWAILSALATGSPAYFIGYVRDPAAKNRQTQMHGSPNYDDETMGALVAYFQTFTQPEKP